MAKKKTPKKEKETPKVNKDLEGFDIKINSFGEIVTSYDLDKINDFLDKNVDDKKLKNRTDFLHKRNIEEGDEIFGEEDDEFDHDDVHGDDHDHDEHEHHDHDHDDEHHDEDRI